MKFSMSFSFMTVLVAALTLVNAQTQDSDCGPGCWDLAAGPNAGVSCDPSDWNCLCHNGNFLVFASRCTMNCDDAAREFVRNRCAPFTSTPAAPTPAATA